MQLALCKPATWQIVKMYIRLLKKCFIYVDWGFMAALQGSFENCQFFSSNTTLISYYRTGNCNIVHLSWSISLSSLSAWFLKIVFITVKSVNKRICRGSHNIVSHNLATQRSQTRNLKCQQKMWCLFLESKTFFSLRM